MALTREIIVTYGAYAISTATGRDLDGKVQITRAWESGSVEFSFFVYGATDAAFVAACVAAEAAFRMPYQTIAVTQGGVSLLAGTQGSTALDAMPEIVKREDVGDTGRSRRYTVRIDYGLPATTGAEAYVGLRDLSVNVSYDPARRRTVTISGTFTANGGTGARDQYEAQFANIETAVFAAGELNITAANRELVGEPTVQADTNDNICEFTRIWEELIFSQAGSSLNDTGIVQQRLSISRRKEAPGDTPTVERLAILDLSYDAWVDKAVTTNLRSKYDSIRSWLVTQIDTTLAGNNFALTEEVPEFFYDENRISVRMTAMGQISGDPLLEQRITVDDDDQKGVEIVPTWAGDPLAAYTYAGPRVLVRTVSHSLKTIGWFNNVQALKFAQDAIGEAQGRNDQASGGKWIIIRQRPQATKLSLGLGDDTLRVTEINVTTQMRYVKEATASSISPEPIVRVPSGGASG